MSRAGATPLLKYSKINDLSQAIAYLVWVILRYSPYILESWVCVHPGIPGRAPGVGMCGYLLGQGMWVHSQDEQNYYHIDSFYMCKFTLFQGKKKAPIRGL